VEPALGTENIIMYCLVLFLRHFIKGTLYDQLQFLKSASPLAAFSYYKNTA
jgi:hypothetical protein